MSSAFPKISRSSVFEKWQTDYSQDRLLTLLSRWFDKGQWPKAHRFLKYIIRLFTFLMSRKRSTSFIYLIIFNMFLARALSNITDQGPP